MGVRRDMLRHAALEEPRHCAEAPRADNHGVAVAAAPSSDRMLPTLSDG